MATALLVAGIFLISACSKPAATVNGKKITRETLEMHLKERVADHELTVTVAVHIGKGVERHAERVFTARLRAVRA